MEPVLYPNFLEDPDEYARSERRWIDLWEQVDELSRKGFEWSHPWVGTESPLIKDGNPIFSAHSPKLRRGVRIIQAEPLDSELDIQVWLGTFGGDAYDPDSIHELVIACVLSEAAAEIAFLLMRQWVRGLPISFERDDDGGLVIPDEFEDSQEIVTRLVPAA